MPRWSVRMANVVKDNRIMIKGQQNKLKVYGSHLSAFISTAELLIFDYVYSKKHDNENQIPVFLTGVY